MKSVTICSSNKFAKEAMAFAEKLKRLGVVVYLPHFYTHKHGPIEEVPPAQKRFLAMGLTQDHFQKVRKGDVTFFFNKGGYIGNSCTLELGYAAALGKPIYVLSDKETETCREVLFDAYTPTPGSLVKYLK